MRIVGALGVVLAGLYVIGSLAAYGQTSARSQYGGPAAAVVDDKGNLRVPSDYRTAYEMLGSWAVAKDEDHVHLLFTMTRTDTVADVIKELKRSSSVWLKGTFPELATFAWQNGYGIFSIGFSQIESVRDYIAGQEEHHRTVSFQDEFREFLKRYEIEFDERYVWD